MLDNYIGKLPTDLVYWELWKMGMREVHAEHSTIDIIEYFEYNDHGEFTNCTMKAFIKNRKMLMYGHDVGLHASVMISKDYVSKLNIVECNACNIKDNGDIIDVGDPFVFKQGKPRKIVFTFQCENRNP